MSPRDALRNLLRFLDKLETKECKRCFPPSYLTDECVAHDPEWKRIVREARLSLATNDN